MGGNSSDAQPLVLLDQAAQALSEAQSFEQIKVIRDKAEAVRKYAQSASLGLNIQNRAAEVKLRAEREAGKLLSQLTLRGGDRRSKNHHDRLKLDDLGISRNQSTRWQIESKLPEDVFREHVKLTCEAGKELTSARLMRLARRWDEGSISAERNGAGAKSNGNGRLTHRNGSSTENRARQWDERFPANALDEMLSELKNHFTVLDGILRPIYTGESSSLRPEEKRALRYLMAETQTMLKRLDRAQQRQNDQPARGHDVSVA